jgi:hypothetical protein
MADRNQKDDRSNAKSQPKSARSDQDNVGPDDGIARNPDPDSQKSSNSRPRGHTEEPDRTL